MSKKNLLVKYNSSLLSAIDMVQKDALNIYGRYDLDKSLVWMAEEFGEVIKAVHKGEGPEAIEEELGDLLAWILCIANITRTSIETALQMTFSKELSRQLKTYQKLKYCEDSYIIPMEEVKEK